MTNPSRPTFPTAAIPAGITRAAEAIRQPRAASRPAPVAAAEEPAVTVTREDLTDRLGLSADATDAEVLAAVDGKLTDGVAERVWGTDEPLPAAAAPARALTADELYAAAWGADS